METAVHHGPAPKGDNSVARAETDEAGEVFLESAQILQDQRHFQPPPDFQSVFTFDAADVISLTRMNASNLTMEESGFCQETSSLMDASGHQDKSCNIGQINHDNRFTDPQDLMKKQHEATVQELMALTSSQPPSTAASVTGSIDGNKNAVDVQQWRDSGIGAYRPNGAGFNPNSFYPGFWRPAYGGYPVSGPSSILSRESSRDDLTSIEGLGQIFEFEDRFRVDRRKLELMMIGRFEPIKEPALDFFQRIGEETSTTIIWPSRLKIGAKSNKDPHIRIGGLTEDCVKFAKSLIMEYLDTKTTRVTMKMDVSYTDHSHIIGKGGNTIRRVMSETSCHVHFPDSNRSNPNEKSNQVSIAGEMEGVEKARARVRELAPLVFNFDLPIVPSMDGGGPSHHHNDLSDPFVKAMQEQYNIQIMFRQKQKNFPTTVVVVKGCEWESSRVKEATLMLIDHLYTKYAGSPSSTGNGHDILMSTSTMAEQEVLTEPDPTKPLGSFVHTVPISMNVEISPIHHAVVLGKGNMTLRSIMQRTKTTILFPDATDPNIPPIRKGSVSVSGSIHNVYFARQQLLGSLPIVMMFDMPDELELVDEAGVRKLQEELDVCISIKPKQRKANKSVLIKAQERNVGAMYKARHLLLGLDGPPIDAVIPETYKMLPQNAGESFFNLNNHIDPMFRLPIIQQMGNSNPYLGADAAAGFNPLLFHAIQQQLIQSQMTLHNQVLPQQPNPFPSANDAGAYNQHMANTYNALHQQNVQQQMAAASHLNQVAMAAAAATATVSQAAQATGQATQQTSNDANTLLALINPQAAAAATAKPGAGGATYDAATVSAAAAAAAAAASYQLKNTQAELAQHKQLNHQAMAAQQQHQAAVANAAAAHFNPQAMPMAPFAYNGLPPNHPYLQDYARLVLKNITGLQQQENMQQAVEDPNNNHVQADGGVKSSPTPSPPQQQQNQEQGHPKTGDPPSGSSLGKQLGGPSPRNSSPTHDLGNLSNQLENLDLDSTRSALKKLGGDRPSTSSISGALDCSTPIVRGMQPPRTRGSSSSEQSSEGRTEWRAPGWEKKGVGVGGALTEYDAKRVLASKALQTKPVAHETRAPTPAWSGLGFSNSLPDHVMREQLASTSSEDAGNQGEAGSSAGKHWFGNSSALDSFLASNSPEAQDGAADSTGGSTSVNKASASANHVKEGHDDLPSLFAKHGLTKYTDLFYRHEIDIQTFASLTENDLKEIGIQTFGARKKLLLLANKEKMKMSLTVNEGPW